MEDETKKNEIIEIDENEEITSTQYDLPVVEDTKKKKKKKRFSKWSKLSKKTKIIIIVSICLVVILIIVLLYLFVFKDKTTKDKKPENPVVIVEKDNYRYEDGWLVFLDEDKNEIGTYECTNKDEDNCYIAYFSDEDDFDETKNVYEDGSTVLIKSDIYLDNYVFIYDDTKESDGDIILYDIKNEEKLDTYNLIKQVDDSDVIVKKDDSYSMLNITDSEVVEKIKGYSYIGYILEGKYIIVGDDDNYKLVDFEGDSISKNVSGLIKSYDDNNISVVIDGKYHIYKYDGNELVSDTYDYVRFADSYIVVIDSKKMYLLDKDGSPMNIDGIKISSTSYNTKIIFDENLTQVDSEELFSTESNSSTFTIKLEDENVNINLYEGKYNKDKEYISYFSGKLYFFKDAEKTELIGSYSCTYANSITSDTTSLDNCYIARESNLLKTEETLTNSYLPIYNERYVFIADTSRPNANDNIILYDLQGTKKKSLATYKAVDASYHEENNGVTFISTSGSPVFALSSKDNYGLINIESSKVSSLIKFKDDDEGWANTSYSILDSQYIILKRDDGTYHMYDFSGTDFNISTKNEIVEYKDGYFKVKTDTGYMIYSSEGIVSSDYKYIIMDSKVYIAVDSDNLVHVYKYSDNKTDLLKEEEITIDGKDYTNELKYSIKNNKLSFTNIYDSEGNTITIELG